MKCFKCSKPIEEFTFGVVDVPNPEEWFYYKGAIFNIIPRYGSRFDDEKLSLGICDDCLHEGVVNNLIKYGDKKD